MLKAAIEKILSLDEPHIKSIEGRTYVDKNMTMIGKELRADGITMNTLSSLVDFIKKSTEDFKDGQYIAQVVSPTEVRLFSSLDADRQRETLAVVKAEIPEFSFGQFIGNEEFEVCRTTQAFWTSCSPCTKAARPWREEACWGRSWAYRC